MLLQLRQIRQLQYLEVTEKKYIIYNSANFISTPWEIIVKIYRNELGERSFPTLKDYSDDFFRFLKTNNFFSSQETINNFFESMVFSLLESLVHESYNKVMMDEKNLVSSTDEERIKILREYLARELDSELANIQNQQKLEDFENLTKNNFNRLSKKNINKVINENFKELFNKALKEKYLTFLFNYIKSKSFYAQSSGLVFAGYGEDQIYPTTISTKIAGVYDDKIRFYTERIESIDDDNNGFIMPFAQRDVIDTLISGISPDINESLFSTFNKFFKSYNEQLVNLIKEEHPSLAESIKNLNQEEICQDFVSEIQKLQQIKHIIPTVSTVSILSKEDLAEMAESLIYLTYLKRRISSHEESVGGPVDVAIISKGDGFIWIKRKHYFDEKYNPHFSQNYFRT